LKSSVPYLDWSRRGPEEFERVRAETDVDREALLARIRAV
jgi:hypothetical protein